MDYFLISVVALLVSTLSFFSGFGLGTLLLPVFALFFSLEISVAATAIVHLVNNLFKVFLIGRKADKKVTLRFTIPAAFMAIIGAILLGYFAHLPALYQYTLSGYTFSITPIKLMVAVLIAVFAMFELQSRLKELAFPEKYVPLGGALSGFFGGLSGHQGALRTAFLIRLGLDKEAYIGTVVLSAVIIDLFRLGTYWIMFTSDGVGLLQNQAQMSLVVNGCVAALAGSLLGAKLLKKVSMQHIQLIVAVMLLLFSVILGMGLI